MYKKPLIGSGLLRVLIFIFFVVTIAVLLYIPVFKRFLPSDPSSPEAQKFPQVILYYLISNGFMLLPVIICCKWIDRRPLSYLGFKWQGFEGDAWGGMFSAIHIISTGTLLLILTGSLTLTAVIPDPLQLLYAAAFFALVSVLEEIIFRGYILRNLMQSMPPAVALMLSAFLFALVHLTNPGIGILPLITLFAAGLMLGINYIYTQNLWFGIFLHFGWMFLQGPILGYPVSGIAVNSIIQQSATGPSFITGGSFGFEGSAVGLVLILAVTFWVSHMYKVRLTKAK